MANDPEVFEDGLPQPRRTWAFLTVMFAVTMAVLDGTIMNVALPSIAADQGVDPAHAIWVVTAYQLAVVVALLPASALGEAIGFRKVYLGGIVLFGLSSLLCAEAPSIDVLIAARLLQGLGAAALMSINGAIIRHIMPRNKLGQGISWTAMTVGVSTAAGPTIAAGILSVATWHWLFLINVPISILVVALGLASLPHNERNGERFDFVSAVLNAFAFGLFILGVGSIGTSSDYLLIGGELAVALVAGVALVVRQTARTSPMLPIDLLKIPMFSASLMSSVLGFGAQFIAFVSLPFYFHDVLGFTPVRTGLLLTAWPAATAVVSPFAGYLADRYSPNPLTTTGMALFAVGLAATSLVPVANGATPMVIALIVCGAGFGLFQSPNNRLLLTTAPRIRSGAASGLQSTARLFGQSIGAAIAAIILGTLDHFSLYGLMWTAAGSAAASSTVCALRNQALRRGYIAEASAE